MVVLLVAGIVFFINAGNKGTIRIELDDRNAVVYLDGDKISPEDLSEPITLKPGEHELIVKRSDGEAETCQATRTECQDGSLGSFGPPHFRGGTMGAYVVGLGMNWVSPSSHNR